MPKYEYDCARCGRFDDFRPMADYAMPAPCPGCGAAAPRAALSVPAMIVGGKRGDRAMTGNLMRASRLSAAAGHGSGCGCCGGSLKISRESWRRKLL